MTNDLKNELGNTICSCRNGAMDDNQFKATVIHNMDLLEQYVTHKILDLVEKEVEKKTIVWADTLQGYIKIVPKHDISTIVNNLKN